MHVLRGECLYWQKEHSERLFPKEASKIMVRRWLSISTGKEHGGAPSTKETPMVWLLAGERDNLPILAKNMEEHLSAWKFLKCGLWGMIGCLYLGGISFFEQKQIMAAFLSHFSVFPNRCESQNAPTPPARTEQEGRSHRCSLSASYPDRF